MTTALLPREATAMAAPEVTHEQMELVKRTVAQGATDAELKLYLYDCARHGVHPLDKLLHFTKRSGKYTPVTSIDFMRIQAANTGDCLGISDPVFAGDLKVPDSFAATVTVRRIVQGQVAEFTATARWSEYKPDQAFMWQKMPHTMLGKCAEALALRKGFPKQLAGLYAREEMDQAESKPEPLVKAPSPAPSSGGSDVIDAAPVVRPDPPAGSVYIEECTPGTHAKKAGEVTFSNGEVASVWKSDAQLFDLAVTLCQEGKPVRATLQPGKGNYGPTLKGLARLDAEHDQRRPEPAGDWTQDIPPADAPF